MLSFVQQSGLLTVISSYFFSEFVKYAYLLFDPTNVVQLQDYVFTTEAHPLPKFQFG